MSCLHCLTSIVVMSMKMHCNLLESLENSGSPIVVSLVVHEGLVFSVTCSSGPGLLVQEAVALLVIILKSPLLGQRWAKFKQ